MSIAGRRTTKWLIVIGIVVAAAAALWFYVFPYLTTLLPENF